MSKYRMAEKWAVDAAVKSMKDVETFEQAICGMLSMDHEDSAACRERMLAAIQVLTAARENQT